MKKIFLCAFFLVLSACANDHTKEKKHMLEEEEVCKTQYPLIIGNYHKRALCIDAAEFEFVGSTGTGSDYALMRADIRDRLTQQVDNGTLSTDDFKLQFQREISGSTVNLDAQHAEINRERRRDALQGLSQSMMNLSHSLTPTQTNCTSTGAYGVVNTNCTTFH